MANYQLPNMGNWKGRISGKGYYLHEKVLCRPLCDLQPDTPHSVLLGYCCDEGVQRNGGRTGTAEGPKAIRRELGKMPNHLHPKHLFVDAGDLVYSEGPLDVLQAALSKKVSELLSKGSSPIVVGGGHDIAYGHYNGIKHYLSSKTKAAIIGIINFDAHFDLRNDENGPNSGTPFFQIAKENKEFHYLCLGIRKDANDRSLFETAANLEVSYVLQEDFNVLHIQEVKECMVRFMEQVDHVYVTVDLDGFSAAHAPGVSAPSPMGFSPEIVLECLNTILATGKLISFDIAEMNPKYDVDGRTAKLGASLIHHIMHYQSLE